MASRWRCGRHALGFERVRLMGVLNVTPDSFSDGGQYVAIDAALAHAYRMIDEGADIIDIGGESTRPGAPRVPPEIELQRVLPVVRALNGAPVPISIDTSAPQVMRAALEQGASIVNDVRGLRAPGALAEVAGGDCGLVVMHMQGEPSTMQANPVYGDVVAEVGAWLAQRCDDLAAAGVARERIAIDPGFGFGKTHAHNRELLAGLDRLLPIGQPLLVGLSRKSSLGAITGRPVDQRLGASIAAALVAVAKGARIVRAHDVAATRDALAVWQAVQERKDKGDGDTAPGGTPAPQGVPA
jgi:dihydropteroate synthase